MPYSTNHTLIKVLGYYMDFLTSRVILSIYELYSVDKTLYNPVSPSPCIFLTAILVI